MASFRLVRIYKNYKAFDLELVKVLICIRHYLNMNKGIQPKSDFFYAKIYGTKKPFSYCHLFE